MQYKFFIGAALNAMVMLPGALAADPVLVVPAAVLSVYDGDTLTADAEPWPGVSVKTSVRLLGIDTPELRGKCPAEKDAAKAARDRLISLAGDRVILHDVQLGKYAGRVVARVLTQDGTDVAEILISEGLGRRYDGGHRTGWCEEAEK